MAIYPTITPLPDAPQRTQSPDAFATTADTFVAALPELVTDVNAAGAYIEERALYVGNEFQGVYAAGTTYTIGQSVEYSGKYYISLVDANLGNTPNTSPSQWSEINLGSSGSQITPNALSGSSPTLSYDDFDYFEHAPSGTTTYSFSGTLEGSKFTLLVDESNSPTYDIVNASVQGTLEENNISGSPEDILVTSDGSKMFLLDDNATTSAVREYSLSSSFDVGSATLLNNFSIGSQANDPKSILFNSDGTAFYILNGDRRLYSYTLSTAYDVSTASYQTDSNILISSPLGAPSDMKFGADGTKLYVADITNGAIYQYTLSTAFNPLTASYDSIFLSGINPPNAFEFNADGTELFIIFVSGNDELRKYNLSTAFKIDTASYSGDNLDPVGTTEAEGLRFDSYGTRLYIMDDASTPTAYQFSVSSLFTLNFPSGTEFPLSTSSVRQAGTKTAFEFATTDTGSTFQCINVQGGIS